MSTRSYTDAQLREAVAISRSISEVLTRLGLRRSGASHAHIKKVIVKKEIATSHFSPAGQRGEIAAAARTKLTPDEILVLGTSDQARVHSVKCHQVRRALLEIGREYQCELCGLTKSWNGSFLRLEIDHINGNWRDNRRENLRFLCPNCHSQQPTSQFIRKQYFCQDCGKEIRKGSLRCRQCAHLHKVGTQYPTKIDWPDSEALRKMLAGSNYVRLAQELGVSDTAIRKRLQRHPPQVDDAEDA